MGDSLTIGIDNDSKNWGNNRNLEEVFLNHSTVVW